MANKKSNADKTPQGATDPVAMGQVDQNVGAETTPLVDPQGTNNQGTGDTENEAPAGTETKKVEPPAPPRTKSKFEKRCEEVAAEYAPHYPTSDAFHFCSDMQVFLSGDKADANAHQLAIDPKIKVFTVNV